MLFYCVVGKLGGIFPRHGDRSEIVSTPYSCRSCKVFLLRINILDRAFEQNVGCTSGCWQIGLGDHVLPTRQSCGHRKSETDMEYLCMEYLCMQLCRFQNACSCSWHQSNVSGTHYYMDHGTIPSCLSSMVSLLLCIFEIGLLGLHICYTANNDSLK